MHNCNNNNYFLFELHFLHKYFIETQLKKNKKLEIVHVTLFIVLQNKLPTRNVKQLHAFNFFFGFTELTVHSIRVKLMSILK